jgi:hypothetical protein
MDKYARGNYAKVPEVQAPAEQKIWLVVTRSSQNKPYIVTSKEKLKELLTCLDGVGVQYTILEFTAQPRKKEDLA